jgi:hypothetical protein
MGDKAPWRMGDRARWIGERAPPRMGDRVREWEGVPEGGQERSRARWRVICCVQAASVVGRGREVGRGKGAGR